MIMKRRPEVNRVNLIKRSSGTGCPEWQICFFFLKKSTESEK